MHRSAPRWLTAITTLTLAAMPLAASAQTPPPTAPPTPQTTTTQTATTGPATAQPPADPKVDAAAAKQHLSAARESLSQLTSLPEAAKLQGDARVQVSQLISNFNELISTQTNWRATAAKVDANVTTLVGADPADTSASASGVAGAVGTTGAAAGGIDLDPAIRAKLVDFRTHLKAFETAAGSGAATTPAPAAADPAAPAANPATPATAGAMPPADAKPSQPVPPATTGTSGVTPASPATTTTAPADQPNQAKPSEIDSHLDAISEILNQSKTGTLTKAQTAALKQHVAELRALLKAS